MSRYAQVHKDRNGPGDGRPTALQIIEHEGLVGKLTDKVFLVTGVSSGIGVETMRALYATGGHVFGTVRNMEKGQKAVDEVKTKTKGGKITLLHMENDNLASIKNAADEFLGQSRKLNVLVANAGVMATPEGKTKDGFETQFGTDHISHFYLFQLLKDALLASSTPDFPSRVVSVSSLAHRVAPLRVDDYNFSTPDSYDPWKAYGSAKTANIYFANEIERRYGSKGLHATSLHPGGIATGLQVHVDLANPDWAQPGIEQYMKSAEQGAATTVYAALGAEWKDKGGRYLSDCADQSLCMADSLMSITDEGHAKWAYDEDLEKRLWADSLKMVGLKDDR